jgi:hypothetical protein
VALAAGHGLGVSFSVTVRSGLGPAVVAEAEDAGSARWFGRVLAPAYERASWRPSPIESHGDVHSPAREWIGVRRVAWPREWVSPASTGSLTDRLVAAYHGLPGGVALRWQFAPLRTRALHWWDEARAVDEAFGRGSRSTVGSAIARPRPFTWKEGPERRPQFWRARAVLAIESGPTPSRAADRATTTSESAVRGDSGNGLVFSHRRWVRRADHFRVSDDELLRILPSSECATGTTDSRESGPRLALGRTPLGQVATAGAPRREGRHLAILGETGMGKSSLLRSIAAQAARFAGVVVFDPVGDTAREVRAELGADEPGRVLWIAASEDLPSLNALDGIDRPPGPDSAAAERRLNDLVHALRRVRASRYADSAYWGPRLEEILVRALRAAAALPDGTLTDAHTLLATGARAPRPGSPLATELVRALEQRIRGRPDEADGARRLLYEVVRSSVLARALCGRRPDFRGSDLVAPGRLTLIAGDADRVGESTARYLLAVLLAIVWSELLARPEPAKTFVLLDEAQWFGHESLAEMLRLGRRRNAHVVLATQSVGSLPEPVGEAVWTNVADFVAFRGSPAEAREFARLTSEIAPETLLALPRGHAIFLEGKGGVVRGIRTAHRRPRDGAAPPDGGAGPGAGSAEIPGSPAPESTETTSTDLLDWISQRAPSESPGEFAVSLAELRGTLRASEEAIRRLGGTLHRTGALLASERRDDGTWWRLDPARLPAANAVRSGAGSAPASEGPQPS